MFEYLNYFELEYFNFRLTLQKGRAFNFCAELRVFLSVSFHVSLDLALEKMALGFFHQMKSFIKVGGWFQSKENKLGFCYSTDKTCK